MSQALAIIDGILADLQARLTTQEEEIKDDIVGDGTIPLKIVDPQIYNIIKNEEKRQRHGLELVASENFTSMAVMQAVGSCLTNKYAEGLPGKRYYGGNEEIDKIESICRNRALQAFSLNPEKWHVNVQPYSGSIANFAAFTALLEPGDRLMGLHASDGGHASHGLYRGHTPVNISAIYFQSLPYHIDPKTGYIDYDDLEKTAKQYCPKLIIGGSSSYSRDWDYKRLRSICDQVEAKLLIDIAHYSGLVAAGLLNNPFEYADVVVSTTHKLLRSTRAGIIFCKKELASAIDNAVFPSCQGGPHEHAIAGIAVGLREVMTPEFKLYGQQVIKNCRSLAKELMSLNYKIVTDGTDTHLLLWDLRPNDILGIRMEYVCDRAAITVNKNCVHGDIPGVNHGGIRLGTPALTSRGFVEKDFEVVAKFLDEACKITIDIQNKLGKQCDHSQFQIAVQQNENVKRLRQKVEAFSEKFPMPGLIL